jgi:peroxiredoxin
MALDAYLYPILADSEEHAKKMEQKYARKYPIFYDESKEVVNMLNQEVKWLKGGRMPGLLIIDKQGIIRYAYYSESMSDIPENDVLLDVLRNIN